MSDTLTVTKLLQVIQALPAPCGYALLADAPIIKPHKIMNPGRMMGNHSFILLVPHRDLARVAKELRATRWGPGYCFALFANERDIQGVISYEHMT